jgi:hypothetical protein
MKTDGSLGDSCAGSLPIILPGVCYDYPDCGAYCRFTSTGSELHCFGGTIVYVQKPNGKFRHSGAGFIGFTFDSGNGTQYGWTRIKTSGEPDYRFILHDYAWADRGKSIQTGQKGSGADASESIQIDQKGSSPQMAAVPECGSLGLLAQGAAGLQAWRQTRPTAPEE